MPSKLTLLKIFLLSVLFTGSLFFVNTYFSLNFSDALVEENYLDKSLYEEKAIEETLEEEKEIVVEVELNTVPENQEEILEEHLGKKKEKKDPRQIFFSYIPRTFKSSLSNHRKVTLSLINDDDISEKIKKLTVEFHKDLIDVRGKMKNKTIKIFDPLKMGESEFLAVFVHEFSHYIDLYFFSKSPFGDTSDTFYSVSWDSTKTMKKGQDTSDFVSGYAMTNKYEDFAETLAYYIFHNKDFQQKALKSSMLRAKYDFLNTYLFENGAFYSTDFSPSNKVKDYYWDITKIDIDTEKFLQYLKKGI